MQKWEEGDRCSCMEKCETGICNTCSARYLYVSVGGSLNGVLSLCMKTKERADTPFKWESVHLPSDYEKALETIDNHLMYWPNSFINKAKFRLTKMTKLKERMKKLALNTSLAKTKKRKREAKRKEELADLEVTKIIAEELWERSQNGALENYLRILQTPYLPEDHEEDRQETGREYVIVKNKKVDIKNLDEEDGMDMGDKHKKKSRARVTRSPSKFKKNKDRVIVEA